MLMEWLCVTFFLQYLLSFDKQQQQQQQQQQQLDTITANTLPIASPPTNTKIRPTMTTNKTHIQPKDWQVPIIPNKNTKKKKKKRKQATPPKTTHKIKQLIIKVKEIKRYLQHVQNNRDPDKFPMSNPTIRTQIAKCEIAY